MLREQRRLTPVNVSLRRPHYNTPDRRWRGQSHEGDDGCGVRASGKLAENVQLERKLNV